ncbi:MAG: hypothetical protein ABI540_04845 [Spartobacteria bacterium]
MKSVSFLALLVVAWFAYGRLTAPITYEPGVLVAAEPSQTGPRNEDVPFDHGKFHLRPLARFSLDARVLHRRIYRYDQPAALVPVDLAVGWGSMSDQAVLDRLSISQSARFFWYEYQGLPPIPREEIVAHATNLHLIPSTDEIASRCRSIRSGELIHLSGLLVEATGPKIGTWRSSLSRTDSGNGACELVWVEDLAPLAR